MLIPTMTELESEGRVVSVLRGKSSVTTVAAACIHVHAVSGMSCPHPGISSSPSSSFRSMFANCSRSFPRAGFGSRFSWVTCKEVSSPAGRDVRVVGGEGG